MLIKYLGHSCFFLRNEEGTSLLIDPYKSGGFGGAISYAPITEQPDICILTHDHEDHAYIQGLPNQPLQIKGDAQARGVFFDAVDTYHDNVEGKERGPNKVFCFELDEIRVCHLGDLGHVLSEEKVKEIGRVDVLLLPIGGTFTIGAEEATTVMNQLSPKIAVPMHFKTDKCAFPIEEVDTFLEGKSPVRRSPTSEVMLRKPDLPENLTILYIPPKN